MSDESALQGWDVVIGSWVTEGSHPMLPGEPIHGTSSFEWLRGRRFVIWRSHSEHPQVPDAITVIGVTDGELAMHYFDERGVHRVYATSFDGRTLRFWRDADPPDLSQRFIGTVSDDGDTISVRGELSRDGKTWESDLELTCRRCAREDSNLRPTD